MSVEQLFNANLNVSTAGQICRICTQKGNSIEEIHAIKEYKSTEATDQNLINITMTVNLIFNYSMLVFQIKNV